MYVTFFVVVFVDFSYGHVKTGKMAKRNKQFGIDETRGRDEMMNTALHSHIFKLDACIYICTMYMHVL